MATRAPKKRFCYMRYIFSQVDQSFSIHNVGARKPDPFIYVESL